MKNLKLLFQKQFLGYIYIDDDTNQYYCLTDSIEKLSSQFKIEEMLTEPSDYKIEGGKDWKVINIELHEFRALKIIVNR